MKRLLLLLLLAVPALAQNDPCLEKSVLKQSVAVNVTTATTTQLVALAAGNRVYVCGGGVTIATSATTADTAQFEYGTGSTCGTGTTTLTGTLGNGTATTPAGVDALFVSLASPGATFTVPPGNALCIVSAGTTVSIQGWVTYVQAP